MTATITRISGLTGLGPAEQARRQLFALYRGGLLAGEWYELRCLDCRATPSRPGPRRYFRSLTELITVAMACRDEWDIFIGIGYRRCPIETNIAKCPHQPRGVDHVSRLPAVWADIDVASDDEPDKPHASVADVLAMLRDAPRSPALVVGSGTGVHAYWPLAEPTTDLDRVVALNQRLRDRFRGDNAIDAARILRIAGTFNHKHGRPRPVELLVAPEVA